MKKYISLILVFFSLICFLLAFFYIVYDEKEKKEKIEKKALFEKKIEDEKKKNYSSIVVTTKKINLYKKKKKDYQSVGTIEKDIVLSLEEVSNFKDSDSYFKIKNTPYYVPYQNIKKSTDTRNTRYQDYIAFPLEIKTKENCSFYNDKNEIVFNLKDSLTFSVIEKKEEVYGISYFGQLFFVKKSDIKEEKEIERNPEVAESIPVLNYHFIYLNGDNSCNESICHSEEQIKDHFSYLQDNKVFTITTGELEKFIDDEIRLPKKSILLTIDDGARAEKFIPFLEEYHLKATLFLVSSWYDKSIFQSDYLELASHTHDMHTTGVCPNGQGGGIRCLEEEKIQEDLKKSRETLNNTTSFCYPFYEYNDYAIEQLKKAGFTIAFIGGSRKVDHNTDKYKVPRYPIHSYHDSTFIKKIIEG